jgi:hypothetical protein
MSAHRPGPALCGGSPAPGTCRGAPTLQLPRPLQVGELIERFSDVKADGKSGSSNIAVLKKALSHVVADCR